MAMCVPRVQHTLRSMPARPTLLLVTAGIALFSSVPVCAQSAAAPDSRPRPDLSPIAAKIRDSGKLPGVVVGIVPRDGAPILAAAGARAATEDAAITADDRMHLGSCTKAFTATLAAALVADGKLSWNTTVGELLGDDARDMHAEWRATTLEELLRHRGGAPASPPDALWRAAFACAGTAQECRAAFVRGLLSSAPANRGKFAYSNQGYAIAGRMLEIAAVRDGRDADGKPVPPVSYETLLAERVLQPLGIERACFGPPSRTHPASPKGHAEDGTVRDLDNPGAIAPAGTLAMPLGDWARFIRFHLGATPPRPLENAARELDALHRRHAAEPFEALGWRSADREWGGAVLTHAGSNTLWYCVAWLAPEKGFAVLAATNQGGDAAAKACDAACAEMITAWKAAR